MNDAIMINGSGLLFHMTQPTDYYEVVLQWLSKCIDL